MKPIVTVVLPVYNVERYLHRCVASVVGQTWKELEILLVDDGSTGGCRAKCDAWAGKDPRIRVIHKRNEGLGMARNTGIENAAGEYICFFDSDDYIAPDTIETALETARQQEAEVVVFGFTSVKCDGRKGLPVIPRTPQMVYEGEEVATRFLPELVAPDPRTGLSTGLQMSACMALFSMETIRRGGWRFVSERQIISEDVYSLLCLYKDVNRVAVVPKALYFYCENSSSLTHTFQPNRFEKIKQFYNDCVVACNEAGYPYEVQERLAYSYLSFTIAALKMIAASSETKIMRTSEFKKIIEDQHLHEVLSAVPIRWGSPARRMLTWAMKGKLWRVCYLMIKGKNRQKA